MADNSVTLVGNVTDDAELRYTPRGQAVANFTIAVNRRYKNQEGQWEDKLDGFFKCNVWGAMAEHAADCLAKGTRILLVGRLQQRSWDDAEGNRRSAFEIQVEEVGPSLKWASAKVTKAQRTAPGAPTGAPAPAPSTAGDWGAAPAAEPAPVGGQGPDEGGF